MDDKINKFHFPDMDADYNIQYPLKPWKQHVFTTLGKQKFFSAPNFVKGSLVISIFTVCSLFYFSIFPASIWRADFDRAIIRSAMFPARRREPRTNISHILFGIGGSAETWGDRRRYSELWWRPNVTRGYVWLNERPNGDYPWPETSLPYRISGDTARFKHTNQYGPRSAIRMARIVKESFEVAAENVRWFVMGDDDTVFFTENLVTVLGKYNHREMYYIGSVSESVEQDLGHSYTMGFGGAGFAISRPLAAALAGIVDGCIDRYAEAYGSDLKIGGCVNEIGVPIIKEPGFHQMDVRGSPYGLLSAHPLAPLVSLHHLDYVEPLFPNNDRVGSIKKLLEPYNSDPGRTLQHTFCYDPVRRWSVSVAWGYNVQLYPFIVSARDLSTPLRTFSTWTQNQEMFTFNTRVSSPDPCQRPVVYFFDGLQKFGNENTTTIYRRPDPEERLCQDETYGRGYSVTGFNVSAPVLDARVWMQAPRRQCCQVIGKLDLTGGGVVQVRLRSCMRGESVTPP